LNFIANQKENTPLFQESGLASPSFKNPFIVENYEPPKKKRRLNPNPERAELSGQLFDEIETVGAGHFGSVIRVKHKLDGCTYALKKIVLHSKSKKSKRAVIREAQVMAALGQAGCCPYVVKYFNSWYEDQMLVIQMEDCRRGNVKKNWEPKSPNHGKEAKKLLWQISSALNFMHGHNIAHLDIKPDNILMHMDGDYRLADFGLATTIQVGEEGRDIQSQVLEGDRRYLALEVLQEKYSNLQAADIFSLGMSMYELLTDEDLPHNGLEWQSLRKNHFEGRTMRCTKLMRNIITTMMSAVPAERYTAKQIMNLFD